MNGIAARTLLAIAMVIYFLFQGWQWPWALMFLAWTYHGVQTGIVFLVEPVEKKKNPATFWAVTSLWVVSCLLMVLSDIYPQYS